MTYTDSSGLNNGTTYYYVVSATGPGGTGSDTSPVSATPAAPVAGVYEPFNYATGTLANGTAATGTGFTGNWTCGAAGTIGAGLTYAGLPVANNALSSGSRPAIRELLQPTLHWNQVDQLSVPRFREYGREHRRRLLSQRQHAPACGLGSVWAHTPPLRDSWV